MIGGSGPQFVIHGIGEESGSARQKIKSGTVKRVLPYTRPYRVIIGFLMLVTVTEATITVASPMLLKILIDEGIMPRQVGVVAAVAGAVAGLAVLELLAQYLQSRLSGRIGEGMIYDLRTEVFEHVQRQPLAFFTRAQTGALVSRLNTDVVSAQQALTTLLSTVVSSALALALVLGTMFYLSWVITLFALLALPLFILPGRIIGRRMQRLMRESMELNAEMGQLMHERFNVAGALLAKLYGRPASEAALFRNQAGRVRDIGIVLNVYTKMLLVTLTFLASIATAVVYGIGGTLAVNGAFAIGTLVALAALLTRLFGPINQLSSVQANVMTALVSFDRLFEVLDLKPLIAEKPGAVALPDRPSKNGIAPEVEFERVTFRYPAARDVSLASLEAIALPSQERRDNAWTLRDLSFRAPAGKLTALVGPSGAGKTTITHLVPRLYDPNSGTVRIGGVDVRDLTLDSLRETIGMVTQDAHLFHDTIRGNLMYARPGATEDDLVEACKGAQIWELISSLPDGFDTVVGDRGYRLSGGEKQRIALARLLLKAPSVVVLDEATAHLDSESEAAVQRALKTALAGRTSLVIAHRLSTIREADLILVIENGEIREQGVHDELLAMNGLYAELYRTQFATGRPVPAEPVLQLNGGPPRNGADLPPLPDGPGVSYGRPPGPPPGSPDDHGLPPGPPPLQILGGAALPPGM
ncbi:ABC transporter ATP-binding protein [Sphaerisporangium aureirubrum]|uniref:ABC transporter ATP-binding protein n=1 Tax=Sphaerisporangium aureirubrum TaxID=1544736 RepID=A0ABW1NHL1_9ACTN